MESLQTIIQACAVGRLDAIRGSTGCILTHTYSCSFSEVSKLCDQLTSPSILEPALWALYLPKSIYKSSDLITSPPEREGPQSLSLCG